MKTLNVNDVVRITQPRKVGTDIFTARVTWVEEREFGQYFGYVPDETSKHGAWGTCRVENEPKPFSARVEVIDHREPEPLHVDRGFMYGHPGYDLLHDRRKP